MKIKIVNKSSHPLPSYETEASAGMDLRANLVEPLLLKPLQRELVSTGLFIELPIGYEAQIRPRSGLAIKSGVSLVNTPGTIDADYRGEIKVIIINLSNDDCVLNDGERIAQNGDQQSGTSRMGDNRSPERNCPRRRRFWPYRKINSPCAVVTFGHRWCYLFPLTQ